jgi:membrane protease YdiL (CAAX protease family)
LRIPVLDWEKLPAWKEILLRLLVLAFGIVSAMAFARIRYFAFESDGIELFWLGSAAMALGTVPAWMLLRPASGRGGFGNGALLVLCSTAVLMPFVVVAAGASPSGPGLESGFLLWTVAIVIAAAAEEIQFRGFLQDVFSLRGRAFPGITFSAAAFALVHRNNPGSGMLPLVNILLFGVLLSMLRIRTGGIWAPTILHIAWNWTTGMALGFNVSGLELPSLFRCTGQLPWGAFGPEGSPILTGILALLCLALAYGGHASGRRNGVPRQEGESACIPDPEPRDGGHQGSCETPDRSAAVRRGSWFLYPGLPGV